MKNTQSVVSSRIFPAFSEKNPPEGPTAVARSNLESIKYTGIKWLCGTTRLEKTYMDTHEDHAPESVERLAKQIFNELHQTIISHESGSLDGVVESVHDMRVGIRRLRVALSNFAVCVPKEDRKRLRLRLENLANALGGVRDMDVMIAAMKASLAIRSDEERPAISALIRRLQARRRSRLRALINYLRGEEYASFKREFSSERINDEQAQPHFEIPSGDVDVRPKAIEEEHGQAA
jgi:CHAD domain-containing protein